MKYEVEAHDRALADAIIEKLPQLPAEHIKKMLLLYADKEANGTYRSGGMLQALQKQQRKFHSNA